MYRLEVLHPRRGAPYVNVRCYSLSYVVNPRMENLKYRLPNIVYIDLFQSSSQWGQITAINYMDLSPLDLKMFRRASYQTENQITFIDIPLKAWIQWSQKYLIRLKIQHHMYIWNLDRTFPAHWLYKKTLCSAIFSFLFFLLFLLPGLLLVFRRPLS